MAPVTITAHELSHHNSADDGWIALDGVVWDVSGFWEIHPGGPQVILQSLGRDASKIYGTIHGPSLIESHLGNAKKVGMLQTDIASITKLKEVDISPSKNLPPLTSIINLHDFEAAAAKTLSEISWEQISGATNDCLSRDLNGDFYRRILFRPRLLRDVRSCDLSREVFGNCFDVPFFNAPFSSAKLSHPDGELALARGLVSKGTTMMVPTLSSYAVDDIVAAITPGHPFFFQVYMYNRRYITENLLRHVVRLGARAIILTIDLPVLSKRDAKQRIKSRFAQANHSTDFSRKPDPLLAADVQWTDIKWLKDITGLPVVLKGIQSVADAKKALEYGCKGIYLSNHGGRALDTAPPSIMTLLEIQAECPELLEKMEVFVDGGIRRGADVLKAICLGASAVAIGRPFFYATIYGEEGVKHAIEILKDELKVAMQLVGITSLDQAHPGLLNTKAVDPLVSLGEGHPWAKKIIRSRL